MSIQRSASPLVPGEAEYVDYAPRTPRPAGLPFAATWMVVGARALTREPLFPLRRRNDDVGVALSAERDAVLADTALPARVRQLRMPALVLHGERDPLPAEPARELAGLLPAGRFAPLPGAGHYPWVEQPRSLAAECRRFLDDLGEG